MYTKKAKNLVAECSSCSSRSRANDVSPPTAYSLAIKKRPSNDSAKGHDEFTTDTIPRESWSVRTKPNPPVPTIIHAPSTNTTPQGHAQLEAPQATQIPTPATPRHTSWSAVAAGTITALPPTQPETASNTSYTEAQMQALLASQEQRLEQRPEQRLEQRLEERLARYDQQLNQMITMLQELIISMRSTPQDPLQLPQTVPSSMRKQRRTEPTVILCQDDNMSDAHITKEDQSQNRTCHYRSQRLRPSKELLHPTEKAVPGTELSQPPPPP
ncbi:hypothetical protein IV203_000088 [Nitzschia inconspicua]|uniref:Uncharacterized protein n=1 Tax=Nitzschia inconspicua TaxID=303405 RepID=A0A9K3L4T9_9STRA|nr:hypothetical protein IV203_000088 [Nitzschia inconspicua]